MKNTLHLGQQIPCIWANRYPSVWGFPISWVPRHFPGRNSLAPGSGVIGAGLLSKAMVPIHLRIDRKTWKYQGVSIAMGVPQNRWFIVENPVKIDDLGIHPFQETSICSFYPLFGFIMIYQKVPGTHRGGSFEHWR